MKNIQEIFENTIFRIPDYQRGYAWVSDQLDDFWQDLQNIRVDKYHYTGTLTFETAKDFTKWDDDYWLISKLNYKPLLIVDGQQRITTVVLLIFSIIETLKTNSDELLLQSKINLIHKYIYTENEKNNLKSYIFGYEIDNPSYEFLKQKIFQQKSLSEVTQPETVYTANLWNAYTFFKEKIRKCTIEELEILFKKVTQALMFDVKVITDDLDIFVVFETMNNRGKALSNLEKLKNRLIYLSTLLYEDKAEKEKLRKEINICWKTCYEFLGKNKSNVLSDNTFLRNHFIVYHYFEKEKDFPHRNLFKDIYTVKKTLDENTQIDFQSIEEYIYSLEVASKKWFLINNPKESYSLSEINASEAIILEKLNRLGFRVFSALILAVYMMENSEQVRINFLIEVERFIFLAYICCGKRSNLGNPYFYNLAGELYKKHLTVQEITELIRTMTDGNEDYFGEFTVDSFISNIKDYFAKDKSNGYYDWSGIKYFLFEYETHLRKTGPVKTQWDIPNSIEHIYPQSLVTNGWKHAFSDYTNKEKKHLCNSLGNLVLLSTSKNSALQDYDFEYKKKFQNGDGTLSGYFNGSHSEIEVSQYKEWNSAAILKRGIKMLDFLCDQWKIELTRKQKKQLLIPDEKLFEKI